MAHTLSSGDPGTLQRQPQLTDIYKARQLHYLHTVIIIRMALKEFKALYWGFYRNAMDSHDHGP